MWLLRELTIQRKVSLPPSGRKDQRAGNVSSNYANVVPSSPIPFILMVEEIISKKDRYLQESQDATSRKTTFFTATALKTSNLTSY
jgi:hypothetical protein